MIITIVVIIFISSFKSMMAKLVSGKVRIYVLYTDYYLFIDYYY